MSSDSTRKPARRPSKGDTPATTPAAQQPERFPLSKHKGTGYWCKKIRGRVFYFGKVADDPKGKAALEQYVREKTDLEAGREPREKTDGLTVADLADRFLVHKEAFRDNGELSPRTFETYHATCATVVKTFGGGRAVVDLVPDDFRKLRAKLAQKRGVVALRNEMQRVRTLFKFAFDEGLIVAPIRFGQAFAKPKLDAVRRAREAHRAEHGDRMFEADELRLILDYLDGKPVTLSRVDEETGEPVKLTGKRSPVLRAMVLLAANCGFGQSDVSSLPRKPVDLDRGWIDFARVKTAVPRRIPLWPETVAAIRDLPERPKPKNAADANLLFLTRNGVRWVRHTVAKAGDAENGVEAKSGGAPIDGIAQEFGKVLRSLELKRPGRGFYAMRHGFETIAGETADQVAVDAIMGHVPAGMSGAYRERIGDDRLRRVVEHVRAWLHRSESMPPETSDPCDPCDPTHENKGKPGVASRSQKTEGVARSPSGSQAGVAKSDGTTSERPGKIKAGVAGSHGSHDPAHSSPPEESYRPSLRLFVG